MYLPRALLPKVTCPDRRREKVTILLSCFGAEGDLPMDRSGVRLIDGQHLMPDCGLEGF